MTLRYRVYLLPVGMLVATFTSEAEARKWVKDQEGMLAVVDGTILVVKP